MILDDISRLALYHDLIPGAAAIQGAYLGDHSEHAGCEVRMKSYETKEDARRRFEVHDATIDLMICRSGAEVIHITPEKDLVPAEPLPGGADGRKMDGAPCGSAVVLREGQFIAIFPGEAHMVGGRVNGAPGPLSKWVVKVPVAPVH